MQNRNQWLKWLDQVVSPVFSAGADACLRRRMPVEARDPTRAEYSHLEAVGRSLAGLGPWLGQQDGDRAECALRERLTAQVRQTLAHSCDPASPDFLNFDNGMQPLVDAAFLAQGLLRAGRGFWEGIPQTVQYALCDCLARTRRVVPPPCNWTLFAATVEAFLAWTGADWSPERIQSALDLHMEVYKGDGAYGDGHDFHWDYYNSYVIHPMLVDLVQLEGPTAHLTDPLRDRILVRFTRYAAVQERMIAFDGSFPPIGRSLAYRAGAFQALAQAALLDMLPSDCPPAAARGALTAVQRRTLEAPGTYDEAGWLRIGLCGHQPGLGEGYISTGSLYLCACAFLPLGLPPQAPFWMDPDADWTSRRIWAGEDAACDHALHEKKPG